MVKKVKEKPNVLGAEEVAASASVLAPSKEVEVIGAAARYIADLEDEQSPGFQIHSKTDSPSKRKGWFSYSFPSIFELSSIKIQVTFVLS